MDTGAFGQAEKLVAGGVGLVIVSLVLPWITADQPILLVDGTPQTELTGLESSDGLISVGIAIVAGVLAWARDWDTWNVGAVTVAGIIVAGIALLYISDPLTGAEYQSGVGGEVFDEITDPGLGLFVALLGGSLLIGGAVSGYRNQSTGRPQPAQSRQGQASQRPPQTGQPAQPRHQQQASGQSPRPGQQAAQPGEQSIQSGQQAAQSGAPRQQTGQSDQSTQPRQEQTRSTQPGQEQRQPHQQGHATQPGQQQAHSTQPGQQPSQSHEAGPAYGNQPAGAGQQADAGESQRDSRFEVPEWTQRVIQAVVGLLFVGLVFPWATAVGGSESVNGLTLLLDVGFTGFLVLAIMVGLAGIVALAPWDRRGVGGRIALSIAYFLSIFLAIGYIADDEAGATVVFDGTEVPAASVETASTLGLLFVLGLALVVLSVYAYYKGRQSA